MEPLAATIAIVAIFLGLALWIARTDGLTFLAPKSTRALSPAAHSFCVNKCRVDGQCPLTQTKDSAADCPLFRFIGADGPTVMYGSPFKA